MKQIYYERIKETLYYDTCENGLQVFLLQKKGFSKTYATISSKLGGINQVVLQNNQRIELPEGIAHFLEHKLFEQNGVDVSIDFAMNQAKVNAFTQLDKTTYLFTATDHILQNIDLLLTFVLQPQFTEERIKKEIDIITQEINMYLDNPYAKIYQTLIKQMYPNHPASSEILGTVDSISKLNKEILETAHHAFYNPKDMIVFIAGNVDIKQTMSHIKASQKAKVIEHDYVIPTIEEDYLPVSIQHSEIQADISVPQLVLGIKLPVYHSKELIRHDLILGMLLDVLFGKSSAFYQSLLTKGYINDSFSKEATITSSHSYVLVGGETKYPKNLEQELIDHLKKASSIQITAERFDQMKKRFVGSFVQAFNYIEFIANNFSKYHFQGYSLFEMLELYQDITIDDIMDMSKTLEKEAFYSSVIMNPIKKGA